MPPQPLVPGPEADGLSRGKEEEWRPPVTVENLQGFTEEMFADWRQNFLLPLAQSPYRYTINSITLAAVPGVEREWTLLIALDDGAAIRVNDFAAWDEGRQTYFYSGLQRAMSGLDQARRKDPVLNRYVVQVNRAKQAKKKEVVLVQADPNERVAD